MRQRSFALFPCLKHARCVSRLGSVLAATVCLLVLLPHAAFMGPARAGIREPVVRALSVGIGQTPVSMTVDERTGRAFVLTRGPLGTGPYPEPIGPGSVAMLDTATGKLLRVTRVGVRPLQALLDVQARRLYVLNQGPLTDANELGPGSVSVLDALTGALVTTTPVGAGTALLAVDAQRGRLFALVVSPGAEYAVDQGIDQQPQPRVDASSVLEATTGKLVRTLPGVNGDALAVDGRAGHLLIAPVKGCPPSADGSYQSSCVGVVDEVTGRLLTTRLLSLSVDFRGLVADDVSGHAFAVLLDDRAANGTDPRAYDHVLTLDALTGTIHHDATLDEQEMQTGAFVVSARAGRVVLVSVPGGYALDMTGGGATVSVMDTRSGHVLHMAALNGGASAVGGFRASVVIDARRGRIIVLAQPLADLGGQVREHAVFTVLDARTGQLLHMVEGQVGDVVLGLDASRGRLFVVNARANTVRLLDLTRFQ